MNRELFCSLGFPVWDPVTKIHPIAIIMLDLGYFI